MYELLIATADIDAFALGIANLRIADESLSADKSEGILLYIVYYGVLYSEF